MVLWFRQAFSRPDWITEERIGELINEVQHQGGTSSAMYAVVPHLITLATRASSGMAMSLLILAGWIYSDASRPGSISCPSFMVEEFAASASKGAALLAPLLSEPMAFDRFMPAVAALAGFQGHHACGWFLQELTLYDGCLRHPLLSSPIPADL